MPQFEVSTYPSQIFWLIVCFLFLCIVMARYLVPRLTGTLEAREQRLQEDLDQSKNIGITSESLRHENLSRLAEARGKAHSHLHQVIQEIHHRKSSRITVLDEELIIKTKNIREDLEKQTQNILNNIEPLVSQVVKATSPRLVGKSISQSEIKALVHTVLDKRRKS